MPSGIKLPMHSAPTPASIARVGIFTGSGALRDAEAQWPWFDDSPAAQRTLAPILSGTALHPALVAILKQPGRYGDIARAAVQLPAEARYPAVAQPALILHQPDDPAYRAADAVAAQLPDARMAPRGTGIAEAVAAVREFLNGDCSDQPEAARAIVGAV